MLFISVWFIIGCGLYDIELVVCLDELCGYCLLLFGIEKDGK